MERYAKELERSISYTRNDAPASVRDVVVFLIWFCALYQPGKIIKSVEEALAKDRLLFLAAQKSHSEEDPSFKDLYSVGTVSLIMKMLRLPDGRIKILVQGISKASIRNFRRFYFLVRRKLKTLCQRS
jgi:ATP-dependent Lon protease